MSQTVHVLLVEDSDKDAALIIRELRKAGFDALWERVDGAEALGRALQSRRWDIVLADYEMPSFDALRALQIVRVQDAEVSFVVVSGTIGEDVAVDTMRAGAQDYVMKDRLTRLGPVVKREIAETDVRRERARAMSALRDSEARKAAILEAALDAVITMDHQGCVVDFNTAAERMFGYRQEDAVGQDMADLIIPPSLRDAHRQGLSRRLATDAGPVLGKRIEFPAMRRDGSLFPAEIAIARIARPGRPMFTGFIRDVTDRKKLESGQRLLAEAGAILVKSLDSAAMMQSVAELVVPRLADWCGVDLLDGRGELQRVAVVPRSPRNGQGDVPTRVDLLTSMVMRAVREGNAAPLSGAFPDIGSYIVVPLIVREMCLGVTTFVRTPGQRTHIPDYPDLLQEARGRMLGAVTLASSESNHVYTEDDVAMAEDLATRMSFAIDNARLYDDAKRAIALRDDFLSIASHELKTPLAPLKLQLQSVVKLVQERRLAVFPPEHLQRLFDRAVHQVDRLAHQVEDLLDVSKLTSGRFDLQLEEADLVTLVRDAVELLTSVAQEKGCVIRLVTPPAAPGRWAPRRIEQVVVNLLTNAMKFGPGKPIEASLEPRGAGFALRVRDHGIGIAVDEQARIFQRFERAVSSTAYGGFGLGLYITQQIVMLHGGRIDVSSEPGDGATFTVWLPAGMSVAHGDG